MTDELDYIDMGEAREPDHEFLYELELEELEAASQRHRESEARGRGEDWPDIHPDDIPTGEAPDDDMNIEVFEEDQTDHEWVCRIDRALDALKDLFKGDYLSQFRPEDIAQIKGHEEPALVKAYFALKRFREAATSQPYGYDYKYSLQLLRMMFWITEREAATLEQVKRDDEKAQTRAQSLADRIRHVRSA